MFIDRLQQVSDRIHGSRMLSLVAKDGIPVETFAVDPALDAELLAAEFMSLIRDISINHQELAMGGVRGLSVTADKLTVMVSDVTEDYFLLLAAGHEANHSRARFELRRAALEFVDDLA